MTTRSSFRLFILVLATLSLGACSSTGTGASDKEDRIIASTLIGAGIGVAVGAATGNVAAGAAIGTAAGATAGVLIE